MNANGNGPWSDAVTATIGPATVTIASDGDDVEEDSSVGAPFTLYSDKPVLHSGKPLNVNVLVSETGDMVASSEEGTKTVSFSLGATDAELSVPTVDDNIATADSVVTAAIQTDADYTVGTPSSATVTVADDDTASTSFTVELVDPSIRTLSEADPTLKTSQVRVRLNAAARPDDLYLFFSYQSYPNTATPPAGGLASIADGTIGRRMRGASGPKA